MLRYVGRGLKIWDGQLLMVLWGFENLSYYLGQAVEADAPSCTYSIFCDCGTCEGCFLDLRTFWNKLKAQLGLSR